MKLILKKEKIQNYYCLVPTSDKSLDSIKKLKPNSHYICRLSEIRSLRHHRWFFGLLNKVYDNIELGVPMTFDNWRSELVKMAGYIEIKWDLEGNQKIEAQSIAFDNMGESEYSELIKECKRILEKLYKERYLACYEEMNKKIKDPTQVKKEI